MADDMTQPSDRARKAAAVCEHGIRWPWACHECDAADPMRPLYAATFERETFAAVVEVEQIADTPGAGCLSDDDGLRELGLLYNYREGSDERQFTRWQMIVAMNHGMHLAAIRNLTPAPREDRNEEPSALVTVGEPNGGDHEHGRVKGQAGASVPAAQPASERLNEPRNTDEWVKRSDYNRLYQQFDAKCREVNKLSAQPASEGLDTDALVDLQNTEESAIKDGPE